MEETDNANEEISRFLDGIDSRSHQHAAAADRPASSLLQRVFDWARR